MLNALTRHQLTGFLLGACLLLGSGSTLAVETFSSLPALSGARVQEQLEAEQVEKIYPLGAVSRISGQLRFARQVHLQGERSRISWQLAEAHTAEEAFAQARRQAMADGLQLLYWCEGRECGQSNLWANAVLGNARLYGPDDGQASAVLASPASGDWLLVYAVTRGNGRGMLHLDRLQAPPLDEGYVPSPTTLLRQLGSDGQLELLTVDEAGQEWVQAMAQALNRNSTLRALLGGREAGTWRQALLDAGVRGSRLELEAQQQGQTHIRVLP